jgi:hypothetical protein
LALISHSFINSETNFDINLIDFDFLTGWEE